MSSTVPVEDDDDWFTKDIDDFVVDIKKNPVEVEVDQVDADESDRLLLESLKIKPKQFFDDIDGNYFDPFLTTSEGASSTTRFNLPQEKEKYIQKIPFSKLLNLSENESHDLFLDIYSQKDQFIKTITQTNPGDELLLVTMKILNKIGSLPLIEINGELFSILAKHKAFWDHLVEFFQRSIKQGNVKKKKSKSNNKLQGVSIVDMLAALVRTLTLTRHFAENCKPKRLASFVDELTGVLDQAGVNTTDLKPSGVPASSAVKNMSIYPTLEGLNTSGLEAVKPNIINGSFPSVEHYQEIHLNLLKEDYMIPLRSDIQAYKTYCEKKASDDDNFIPNSIQIHNCVKLRLPFHVNRCSVKEELIIVDLDPQDRTRTDKSVRYQKLGLQNSKRLMHGSMVCLTSSVAFEDLIVAVISHRDSEQLSNGYVCIDIISVENIKDIFNRDLLMIESEIFFEPYHQVFNVLKNFKPENFPMKSYIVECNSMHQFPGYVGREKQVVFSHRGQSLDIKAPNDWPENGDAIGLNLSQYKALKLALTHKFAIIQGPPGTGKTHIGLEIVSALLANTKHRILLICQTNHSLDQFLSGMLKYTTSLVRMGSQSKHALLDSYNLKQLNEDVLIDKRLRTLYYNTKQEYLNLMKEFDIIQKSDDNKAIVDSLNLLQKTSRRIHELNQLSSYEFVKNIRVIGMTTTFAARNHTLLEMLQTPIVVIDEAAEVLEAHIVASLTLATEHCILIGDHQQLRPTTSVYALSKHYQMNISLFERMIWNQVNVVCLNEQYRMRPEIADLIRPVIYPGLQDCVVATTDRPKVRGMRQSMFFFTHKIPEDDGTRGGEKSKKNSFECKFLLALCEYLVAQGYGPKDIVILTAYNGQMLHLVQERKAHEKLHGIRITVVDNFQGEEANIVLLSLVRSNKSKMIGFLSQKNRICTALSRARDGLYMVGNMDVLAKASKTWKAIHDRLKDHSAIGNVLELMCEEHMTLVQISKPEDFDKVSYGGCQDMCRAVKECGHQCDSFCHGVLYPHRKCLCVQD